MNPAALRTALALVLLLVDLFAGCHREKSPEVAIGIDGCAHCGMVISDSREVMSLVRQQC